MKIVKDGKYFEMSPEKRKYHRDNARKNYHKRAEYNRKQKAEYRRKFPELHSWSVYTWGARARKMEFTLTKEDFFGIIKRDCVYCGAKPSLLNGVDREDNKKGYVKDNCVPCCAICNHMKHTLSVQDFINHCAKISERTNL